MYVNSSNTNSSPNGSQANPYKTIQAAINAAAPSTTILVETGKGYNESDTVKASLTNLTINADTSQAPVLDGGAGQIGLTVFSTPGFTVAATGVTISGFTIENFATGIVLDSGASLTLSVDTIKDNANAHGDGGGVINAGTLKVLRGAISDNSASGGGGIYNSGGQVQISGTVLSRNSALSYGGGILVLGGSLTINGGTLSGNFGDGGGIADLGGIVTVTGGTLSNNIATGVGGGIYLGSGSLTITGATLAGNSAYLGGGIFNSGGGAAVTACAIANNTALNSGGGIYNYSGPLKVTNSTLANNSAVNGGGGISCFTAGSVLTTVNTTIVYNTAGGSGEGGGLDAGGTTTLYNTIVALNTDTGDSSATADDIAGTVSTASSYNLIGVGGSGGLTVGNSTGNLLNVSRADAGLAAALINNGGPTKTVALLATSVGIDAGSASIPGVTVPTTDRAAFLEWAASTSAPTSRPSPRRTPPTWTVPGPATRMAQRSNSPETHSTPITSAPTPSRRSRMA